MNYVKENAINILILFVFVANTYFLYIISVQFKPQDELNKQVQLQGQYITSIVTLIQQAQQNNQ